MMSLPTYKNTDTATRSTAAVKTRFGGWLYVVKYCIDREYEQKHRPQFEELIRDCRV